MIQRIKNWFSKYRDYIEKQRRMQTLGIIKEAKKAYLDHKNPFMCICFQMVEPSFSCYDDIVRKIPEFKPSTFGLHVGDIKGCWWVRSDRESRIKAFDKLIEIYSK